MWPGTRIGEKKAELEVIIHYSERCFFVSMWLAAAQCYGSEVGTRTYLPTYVYVYFGLVQYTQYLHANYVQMLCAIYKHNVNLLLNLYIMKFYDFIYEVIFFRFLISFVCLAMQKPLSDKNYWLLFFNLWLSWFFFKYFIRANLLICCV